MRVCRDAAKRGIQPVCRGEEHARRPNTRPERNISAPRARRTAPNMTSAVRNRLLYAAPLPSSLTRRLFVCGLWSPFIANPFQSRIRLEGVIFVVSSCSAHRFAQPGHLAVRLLSCLAWLAAWACCSAFVGSRLNTVVFHSQSPRWCPEHFIAPPKL